MQPEVVGRERVADPESPAVFVGALMPFGILDDCCGGCGLGAIAAPSSTPTANAIPDRPTTSRAVVKRCGE